MGKKSKDLENLCPECGEKIIILSDSGELVCEGCGLVIVEHIGDSSPEIKKKETHPKKKEIDKKELRKPAKIFEVNDFITLKLEQIKGGDFETVIYVQGKRFDQCKFLLLDIPVDELKSLDEIESVDEAAERLDHLLERNKEKIEIPPKMEFWGHCSNLQVWVENNYDTRLVHSNLAFPLLKKLTELGDPIAKRAFKDEIAKRLESGHPSVVLYLIDEDYIDFFNEEEKNALLNNENSKFLGIVKKAMDEYVSSKDVYPNSMILLHLYDSIPTVRAFVQSIISKKFSGSYYPAFIRALESRILFDPRKFTTEERDNLLSNLSGHFVSHLKKVQRGESPRITALSDAWDYLGSIRYTNEKYYRELKNDYGKLLELVQESVLYNKDIFPERYKYERENFIENFIERFWDEIRYTEYKIREGKSPSKEIDFFAIFMKELDFLLGKKIDKLTTELLLLANELYWEVCSLPIDLKMKFSENNPDWL